MSQKCHWQCNAATLSFVVFLCMHKSCATTLLPHSLVFKRCETICPTCQLIISDSSLTFCNALALCNKMRLRISSNCCSLNWSSLSIFNLFPPQNYNNNHLLRLIAPKSSLQAQKPHRPPSPRSFQRAEGRQAGRAAPWRGSTKNPLSHWFIAHGEPRASCP